MEGTFHFSLVEWKVFTLTSATTMSLDDTLQLDSNIEEGYIGEPFYIIYEFLADLKAIELEIFNYVTILLIF